jgi:hypothetical protein
MRTLRRVVASFGAAMALGLAMTGVTLAADPVEVDVSAILGGGSQADDPSDLLDLDVDVAVDVDIDAAVDAAADIDATSTIDADALLDADATIAANATAWLDTWADDSPLIDAEAVVDADADIVADIASDANLGRDDVTGFLALDVCARLAILEKAGSCGTGAPRAARTGDAVLDGAADVHAAAVIDHDDDLFDLDDPNLAAAIAADACVRLAILGDAGSCAADQAPDSGTGDGEADLVEALARLAATADAATATDEDTLATAALDACVSLGLFSDAVACGLAGAPDDGDTAPDDGDTAPDDGDGAAPGSVTRPDASAGGGPGGSLPDTASRLFDDPFGPAAVVVMLFAGGALLRRMRGVSA